MTAANHGAILFMQITMKITILKNLFSGYSFQRESVKYGTGMKNMDGRLRTMDGCLCMAKAWKPDDRGRSDGSNG